MAVVSALVMRSGETGLSAFLPDPSRRFPTRLSRGGQTPPKRRQQRDTAAEAAGGDYDLLARLPVAKRWETADFTLRGIAAQVGSVSVRHWVLQAIYRYRFAIGGFILDTFAAGVASCCAVASPWLPVGVKQANSLFLRTNSVTRVGTTSSKFARLETPVQSNSTLLKLDDLSGTIDDPALICINDDVRWEPEKIQELLQGWMGRRWRRQAAWEV